MADYLWVETYRPTSIEDYVFTDANQREQVEQWLKDGHLPGHMLFSGSQGVGKTSLAKLLLKSFKIPGGDVLEINASLDRRIETLRDRIVGFCSTWSLGGGLRYILLDEADHLAPLVQPALRGVMEKYHESARFILTCNYPNKIIPAIHSRVQQMHFKKLDETEFATRIIEILMAEKIDFDPDFVTMLIDMTYPDLRKCINLAQQHSPTGKLMLPDLDSVMTLDYLIDAKDLIKTGKIIEARKLICSQAREEEYPDIYRFMYENLDLWSDDQLKQDEAIIIIARYLRDNALFDDKEINLSSCLVELGNV